MAKITIIGAGSVGATIAFALTIQGIASEIVMIDINSDKVLGEALDIRQGISFCPPTIVQAGSYRDAEGSDIVIVTSGVARKPGQTRLDLAQINIDITKSIIPEITKYAPDAAYIIVSNPVDILTYVFNKCSDIPENKIIGSGTVLDTARLRARISEYYSINQQNVHAYVFGEHGDSSFIPWSLASISMVGLEEYPAVISTRDEILPTLNYSEVEQYMKKSGAKVIQRKGATFYAVSLSVCHICKCLLKSLGTTLTVSTMMHGEYGVEDVCLSALCVVGDKKIGGRITPVLTEEEVKKMQNSANCLKEIIRNVKI